MSCRLGRIRSVHAFRIIFFLSINFSFTDAKTDEFLQVKIFDRNFQVSDSEAREMLKKADLESHGYKMEATTKVVKEPGSDKPRCQVCHYKLST